MSTHKLENYLRAYRKRSGLTQRDVAFLLGCQSGTQVSRYEKRHRVPPLETALACEAVFGVPMSELFAGIRDRAARRIGKRFLELRSKLQESDGQKVRASEARIAAQKMKWIATRTVPAAERSNVL
jgi:transcriptional regulator with XRE-family HTH domain